MAIPQTLIELTDNGDIFLKIISDGTIWLAPGWAADKAAEEFFNCLNIHTQGRVSELMQNYVEQDVHNDAIDSALFEVETYHDNSLEFQIAGSMLKTALVKRIQQHKK